MVKTYHIKAGYVMNCRLQQLKDPAWRVQAVYMQFRLLTCMELHRGYDEGASQLNRISAERLCEPSLRKTPYLWIQKNCKNTLENTNIPFCFFFFAELIATVHYYH
jgi:hypothetical protein